LVGSDLTQRLTSDKKLSLALWSDGDAEATKNLSCSPFLQ